MRHPQREQDIRKEGVLVPTAAVTNYFKLSGLTHHTLILLQFWRSEVEIVSLKADVKFQQMFL